MTPTRVLIADNDPKYLRIAQEVLSRGGLRVIVATNPEDASRILEREPISLAILDLRLENDADDQDISGLVLAKNSDPNIPKIILSRFPTYETVHAALGSNLDGFAPAIDFVDKSKGIEALVRAIEIAVHRRISLGTAGDKALDVSACGFQPQHGLRVFLCHASSDKPSVRELYRRLRSDGITPWLDEADLFPGQEWEREISKAVRSSDIVIVCLSRSSVSKKGYVQREIKIALDVADEQPEGTVFIIPLKLEECDIPERLRKWQWVNYFEEGAYERLMHSLRHRAEEILVESKKRYGQ